MLPIGNIIPTSHPNNNPEPKMTYSTEQLQAAADQLGFQNIELVIEYFRMRLMAEGLYEELRGEVAA